MRRPHRPSCTGVISSRSRPSSWLTMNLASASRVVCSAGSMLNVRSPEIPCQRVDRLQILETVSSALRSALRRGKIGRREIPNSKRAFEMTKGASARVAMS